MNKEIYGLMLNGIPIKEFFVYFIFFLIGTLMFFLYSVYKGVQYDGGFSWKKFWKGTIRVVLSVITGAMAIIYWEQISMFIFATDQPVELNGWSSFLMGTMVDGLLEKILGGSKDATKFIAAKRTKAITK